MALKEYDKGAVYVKRLGALLLDSPAPGRCGGLCAALRRLPAEDTPPQQSAFELTLLYGYLRLMVSRSLRLFDESVHVQP